MSNHALQSAGAEGLLVILYMRVVKDYAEHFDNAIQPLLVTKYIHIRSELQRFSESLFVSDLLGSVKYKVKKLVNKTHH